MTICASGKCDLENLEHWFRKNAPSPIIFDETFAQNSTITCDDTIKTADWTCNNNNLLSVRLLITPENVLVGGGITIASSQKRSLPPHKRNQLCVHQIPGIGRKPRSTSATVHAWTGRYTEDPEGGPDCSGRPARTRLQQGSPHYNCSM